MLSELIIHPTTQAAVESWLANPTHAIGLIGPPGAGKTYLAQWMARLLTKDMIDALYSVSGEEKSIGIDEIRSIRHFLRLKHAASSDSRRVVFIQAAHNMGDEAQNALLKMLEEPPQNSVFILTADSLASLKNTIRSRVQVLHILPVSLEAARSWLDTDEETLGRAHRLSAGYPGLLWALATNSGHELSNALEQAKSLIRADTFKRITLVDELAKDKQQLTLLLFALRRLIEAVIATTTSQSQLLRLTANLRNIYDAERDLRLNGNPKLVLADLFLSL